MKKQQQLSVQVALGIQQQEASQRLKTLKHQRQQQQPQLGPATGTLQQDLFVRQLKKTTATALMGHSQHTNGQRLQQLQHQEV
jgi:hypothetical protein